MSQQFLRFISGNDDIDWTQFMQEMKNMTFSSASRIGRSVGEDDVDEISSMFFEYLWENRDKRPFSEEECFAKLKRFVYEICAPSRVIGGFDEKIECEALSYVSKKEVSKSIFYEGIETIHIPKAIKKKYLEIIDKTDVETLFELCEKPTFLGSLLLSFLLRKPTIVSDLVETSSKDMFSIKSSHDEIYLACLMIKLGKYWPICSYVMWGNSIFSSLGTFMSPVLVPGCERYFKNLFLSIRVYLEVEHYKIQHDDADSFREASWKLSIRMRDVCRRYGKIKRIIKKYDDISELFSKELEGDYSSLCGVDKQQLSFDFLLGAPHGRK